MMFGIVRFVTLSELVGAEDMFDGVLPQGALDEYEAYMELEEEARGYGLTTEEYLQYRDELKRADHEREDEEAAEAHAICHELAQQYIRESELFGLYLYEDEIDEEDLPF